MKINVRQEATEGGGARGCIWAVGDDGETTDTVYLEPGQEVNIEIEGNVSLVSTVGEPGPIGAVPPQESPEETPTDTAAEEPGGAAV